MKRVIAVGGDTIEVRCNVVYVNGTALRATMLEDEHRCSYPDYIESMTGSRWEDKQCSRYRETSGDHDYEVFHDPARPERDRALAAGTLAHGDSRDFPMREGLPSCANAPGDDQASAAGDSTGTIVETKAKGDASACEPQVHFVVPDDEFFVMGDNRSNSNDSRVWGTVKRSAMVGRVVGTWYPFAHFGAVR
jgi:signal peptidase I